MTVRIKQALRRGLPGLTLGAFIAFVAVAPAAAQWLRPWPAVSPDLIEQRLEAQGYLLMGPLRRRPMVYLADVSGGPAGYQRLVIDAWSGAILQRFVGPPRRWGPVFAMREGGYGEPMPPGGGEPMGGGGFPPTPNDFPAKSASGGPPNVQIPAAISPFGAPDAPSASRPKPKSSATYRDKGQPAKPGATTASPAAAPLPPPAPRAPDQLQTAPAPTEVEKAAPPPPDQPRQASVGAVPGLKMDGPKIEAEPEAQKRPSVAAAAAQAPTGKAAAPELPPEPKEKAKVSIVPAEAFE